MDRTQDTTLSGVDRDRLHQAAELLLEARRTVQPIDDLPPGMAPRTLEEAYYVQDLMLKAIGKAGGWKVGAMSPDGTPFYAPMPVDGFTTSGERIAKEYRRLRGVEAEIAFLMGKDLPPRATPYSRAELVDAIASCHPAIELLESGLLDPDSVGPVDSDCGSAVKWRVRFRLGCRGLAGLRLRQRERANECGWLCARGQRQKCCRRRFAAPGPMAGQ